MIKEDGRHHLWSPHHALLNIHAQVSWHTCSAQLVNAYNSMYESLHFNPSTTSQGILVHDHVLSPHVATKGSGVQGHLLLHSTFQASLGSVGLKTDLRIKGRGTRWLSK